MWAWTFLVDRMAWPTKNAARLEATPTAATAAANTAPLAARTVRRWGTAAKVDRIIPVEYSAVMTRTPSTPTASWASRMPLRLNDVVLNVALSVALRVL